MGEKKSLHECRLKALEKIESELGTGKNDRLFPLDFQPERHQFQWMLQYLDGWQFGEQGLIPAILEVIGGEGLCVEYGAGDGESLPLTIDRICNARPSDCILVEIDDVRRKSLQRLYPVENVFKSISWDVERRSGEDHDVVVIDIDGMDSVVMRQMLDSGCRPALLVVEHMDRHYSIATTAPAPIPEWMLGMRFISEHAIQDTAETLHWIAAKYGYERIGLNRCNSFFVRKDLFPLLFR